MRIAMGLKKDFGKESNIVALGTAKLIGIYNPGKKQVIELSRKDCGDCISAIGSLDIEALYQPVPKICPTSRYPRACPWVSTSSIIDFQEQPMEFPQLKHL